MLKWLSVGIILLFIGTIVIPSATSEQTAGKKIITVDDEPGDADYISIKDAVNNSNPGDVIEIYSGTYYEEGITVDCNNITIIGISEELGQGNDTEKPFIQGNGYPKVLQIAANDVFITNLRIENMFWSGSYGLLIGIDVVREFNNITVTNMSVRNCVRAGIAYCASGNDIILTHNDVQNCYRTGMIVSCFPKGVLCSNNLIINCSKGIEAECDHNQFSDNIIRGCSLGIRVFQGESNQILSNNFEDCEVAIYLELGRNTTISKNNFINYSKNDYWWEHSLLRGKNSWTENYWSTWKGVGPQPIRGICDIGIFVPIYPFFINFPMRWLEFDWHPAQEPYDIPRMS